jgi:Sugar phosphate permease
MALSKTSVEDSPFTPFLMKLSVYSSGGPFLDGYILVIIGIALIQLGPALQLDTFWTGMIGAAALVGLFLGGAVFGYVTDLVGRKLMYTIDLIAIIIFSILQMFVSTPMELFFLRFAIGIAVGADYPIATALLAEFAPRKYRGILLGELIVMWYLGACIADLVGFAFANTPGGWRWMLGSAAIPALILVIGRWGTPESARWLASKGRLDEARAVLKQVYGPEVDIEFLDEVTNEQTRYSKLLEPEYLKRIIFVGGYWMAQVVPCFAIYTFGPTILGAFGLEKGNLAILGDSIISLFFLLGCFPALFLINSMGRRPMLNWSFVFMTLAMFILGFFPAAPTIVIISAFALYAFFSGPPSVLDWVYPNELFPTEIRASAVGLCTAISRIGAALGTFLLPFSLKSFGIGPTMLICAVITLIGLILSIFMAPETKGMTLAESSSVRQSSK